MSRRDQPCTFHRDPEANKLCTNPETHHALKYHDPDSDFYLGTDCVNCTTSYIERKLEAQWAKDNGLVEYSKDE